jgi:hypothetical protein
MTYLHKLANRLARIRAMWAPGLLAIASCKQATVQDYLGPDPSHSSSSQQFTALRISPRDAIIAQGDSVQLIAFGYLPSGNTALAAVNWAAAGGTVSTKGWFRGEAAGAYVVRAVAAGQPGLADSATVTVQPFTSVSRVDVSPQGLTLTAGGSTQFAARALLTDGRTVTPVVTWQATGGSITPSGLFTATGNAGQAAVTAVMPGSPVTGSAVITVTPPLVTRVTLSPKTLYAQIGQTMQLSAALLWSDGSSGPAPVTWSATGGVISQSGLFTPGNTTGAYRIVASAGGVADTAQVTVVAQMIRLRIEPKTLSLVQGAAASFAAIAVRNDASENPVAVQWSALGGAITPQGAYAAALVSGQYQVVASTYSVAGQLLADTAMVTVVSPPSSLTQLRMSPVTATLVAGQSVQFSVSGVWGDGSGAVPAVDFSSTGGAITASGLFTAPGAPGSYTVTATQRGGGKSASASVLVRGLAPTSFDLSPKRDTIASGQVRQFATSATWNDGLSHPYSVSFSATGGTISSSGSYSAGSLAGQFLVIAACSCGSADTAQIVIPSGVPSGPSLLALNLAPRTVSLNPGDVQQFAPTAVWSDGARTDVSVTYLAQGGSITPGGLYQAGSAPGTYAVIAMQQGGALADTAIVSIGTSPSQGAVLNSLVMNPSAVTVPIGASQQFVVAASWSDGTTALPPLTFTATGGTVTPAGLYTAGATPGVYSIIVRNQAGTRADTSAITIPAAVMLTQVVLNPSSVTLAPGGTRQFIATGVWSDGSTNSVPVTYTATGGTITTAGLYTAGSVGGNFSIIAVQTGGTKADTSSVTVGPPTPPPGVDTVSLRIERLDGGTGEVLVSNGIPLPPGRLRASDLGHVRVLVGGVEQASYVEALKGLHKDGSLRSILIQFHATVGATPVQAILDFTVSRTVPALAKTPVLWALPAAVALPTSADYLVSTQFMGPTVTAARAPAGPAAYPAYEANFVHYSDYHWNVGQPGYGDDWTTDYYDRAFSHFAFWARTGNSVYWVRAARIAYNYRTIYLEANNYWSSEYWSQLKGLAAHYWLTGDERSRNAVYMTAARLNASRGGTERLTNTVNHPWMDNRVQARVLIGKLLSMELEAPPFETVSDWAAGARQDLTDILSTQAADGSYRFYSQCGESSNFMSGELSEVYTNYYDDFEPDPRIPPAIKRFLDYLWNTQWRPADQVFNYYSGYCAGSSDGATAGWDLNGFFVEPFGWYYRYSGDPSYRDHGEQSFSGLVTVTWLEGPKQFNQAYVTSFRWLAYR